MVPPSSLTGGQLWYKMPLPEEIGDSFDILARERQDRGLVAPLITRRIKPVKYMISFELSPETGIERESQPQEIQDFIGKWQALDPIAIYLTLTSREVTIILEASNEDAFFAELYATWVFSRSYPTVRPIVTVDEFPQIMQRIGLA